MEIMINVPVELADAVSIWEAKHNLVFSEWIAGIALGNLTALINERFDEEKKKEVPLAARVVLVKAVIDAEIAEAEPMIEE